MSRAFRPTEEQRFIISLTDGPHLVVAPPGAGKTQVLTERIISLLRSEAGSTFRVLALTFTTKAAENLRHRVEAALGDESRRVTAVNFHGFCLDALQHYGELVGFAPDTSVYDAEDDRLDVLRRALEQEGLDPLDDKRLRALLARIGGLKRALTGPAAVKDASLATAYGAYDRVLRQYHACDFDDLLWLTWRLLTENARISRHYRRLYRHIMVDEAQDTSRAQYEVIRAICGNEHRNVMLVADSDQFIYRFAGASDRWLKAFERDFGATTHHLTTNFRCAASIIQAANLLIAGNPGRAAQPPMTAGTGAAGHVAGLSFADEAREAQAVTAWIQLRLRDGLHSSWCHPDEDGALLPEDICVLARNRYSLDAVRTELDRQGITYLFNAGQRGLVETAGALLVIQALRIIQNPADRVTRENVLAGWSEPLLDEGVAELPPQGFFERLAEVPAATPFVSVVLKHIAAPDSGALVTELLQALDLSPADEEADRALKAADFRTLSERWEAYRGHVSPDDRSIAGFLGELALAGRSVVEGPGVRVLTVHAAKGLEFRAVAVVGMNEGTFPDYRSVDDDGALAEERRSAYVAVTRASRELLLTRPRSKRMPWGADRSQQVSRFIAEAGLSMLAK